MRAQNMLALEKICQKHILYQPCITYRNHVVNVANQLVMYTQHTCTNRNYCDIMQQWHESLSWKFCFRLLLLQPVLIPNSVTYRHFCHRPWASFVNARGTLQCRYVMLWASLCQLVHDMWLCCEWVQDTNWKSWFVWPIYEPKPTSLGGL